MAHRRTDEHSVLTRSGKSEEKRERMIQEPRARHEQLIIQEVPNELLIYDLNRHRALCLNSTTARVWQKCDGKRKVSEIAAELTVESGSPVSEALVWVALEKLGTQDLLEERMELPARLAAIPRREMMRRMRVASLIAVPLIASVLAPTAQAAATLAGAGSPCIEGAECSSGTCFMNVCP